NPMISGSLQMADSEIEKEIFKKYKMNGLLLSDEQIVKMMDTSLESGRSQIVPAGVKNNSTFYSSSKVAGKETFTSLQTHIHHLMRQARSDMTAGSVDVNPYQHNQRIACTHCQFLSVCQFDPKLEGNDYHKLSEMKDDEILDNIRAGEV